MAHRKILRYVVTAFAILAAAFVARAAPLIGHVPNVIDDCGAAGDGRTDDTAAFNTCFSRFAEFDVPDTAGGYRIADHGGTHVGLTIPDGVRMHGLGFQPGNPPTGATILCDLHVTPCVSLSNGSNGTAEMDGIVVSRALGAISPGVIGVLTHQAYNPELYDVFAYRHAIGFDFEMCGAYGLGGIGDRLFTGAITDAHFVFDGIAEFRLTNSRAGMNGLGDFNATSYVRIEGPSCGTYIAGSGPNTLYFSNDQFNQGSNVVDYWLQFINLVSGPAQTVEYYFDGIHVEGVGRASISSDASWTALTHVEINNLTENDRAPVFALSTATTLQRFHINNAVWPGSLTLAPTNAIAQLDVSNTYLGAVSLTGAAGSSASFSTTDMAGVTLGGGPWGALSILGGDHYAGTVSNSATGNIQIQWAGGTSRMTCPSGFGLAINGSVSGITYAAGYPACSYELNAGHVLVYFLAKLTSKGTGIGAVTIVGLPHQSSASGFAAASNSGCAGYLNMASMSGAPTIQVIPNSTTADLYDPSPTGTAHVMASNLTHTTYLACQITYPQ
jgi:hypothetical protein